MDILDEDLFRKIMYLKSDSDRYREFLIAIPTLTNLEGAQKYLLDMKDNCKDILRILDELDLVWKNKIERKKEIENV